MAKQYTIPMFLSDEESIAPIEQLNLKVYNCCNLVELKSKWYKQCRPN
jgi:hypothetical protein